MLRSVCDFRRFTIAATDGSLGRVGDLYFDDRNWAVRYLAVDEASAHDDTKSGPLARRRAGAIASRGEGGVDGTRTGM
jgi:hypothetical protein